MDTYRLREHTIANVAEKLGGLGKTGMMKVIYLLQQVYKAPLDFEFKIYTYGPYDGDVLTYIDIAEQDGLIRLDQYEMASGSVGYRIYANTTASGSLSDDIIQAIDEIAANFSEYTARDWELAATIIYVYVAHIRNNMTANNAVMRNRVNSLKPHFTEEDISIEYDKLVSLCILDRAAAS